MLRELAIRNFAIIRDIRLQFETGFQALTGETGAGKSIIIDALGALLGSRLSADFVRTDEKRAWIEGIFDVQHLLDRPSFCQTLDEAGVEPEDGLLILSRDITDAGRSTTRINSRTVTLKVMGKIGQQLVDIHGQSEHLSLLRPALHLDMLDQYAGTHQDRLALEGLVAEYHSIRRRIERIHDEERERAQRVDILRFQVEEITSAELTTGEDDALLQERQILNNAEKLQSLARHSWELMEGDDEMTAEAVTGALDRLREASDHLAELAQLDPSAESMAGQIREATILLEETVPVVRDYADTISADPARLDAVEERLGVIRELTRKYGPTLDEVIEYGEQAASELVELESGEARVEDLRHELEGLRSQVAQAAQKLSVRRKSAAKDLDTAVERAIADMHMGGAVFVVDFGQLSTRDTVTVETGDGSVEMPFDSTGIDRVEFLIAPNAGEQPRPLARIASGGETARLMLALKSILSDVDDTPTLIFDEVDVGVGGRSGQAVGEKLWMLSRDHQVIVISHLSQIAAFANSHFRITKHETDGRTETRIDPLFGDERIDEIAAMLDGLPPTEASRANARTMLDRVGKWIAAHS